jgi:hypothetical protein
MPDTWKAVDDKFTAAVNHIIAAHEALDFYKDALESDGGAPHSIMLMDAGIAFDWAKTFAAELDSFIRRGKNPGLHKRIEAAIDAMFPLLKELTPLAAVYAHSDKIGKESDLWDTERSVRCGILQLRGYLKALDAALACAVGDWGED